MKRISKRYWFLLVFAVLPSLTYGQGAYVPARTVNSSINGVLRPVLATITVCAANTTGTPCSPALAGVLFKDQALTQPLANPTTTDGNGNYPTMALAAGNYTITETATGFTGFSYQITITCGIGGCAASSLNVTGATTLNSLTVSGTGTFTGLLQCKNFENVQCVDSTLSRSGSDIGNEINLAYAALPSTGGTIWVFPNATGTCYNYTTPIVFGVNLKKVKLIGFGASSTCLNFTPASGVAITFDTGSKHTAASGFSNLLIEDTTAANTATCVQLSVSVNGNGEDQFKAQDSTIQGCKFLSIWLGNGTTFPVFNVTYDNVTHAGCSTAAGNIAVQQTSASDNNRIINSDIFGCATLVTDTAVGDWSLNNVSFEGSAQLPNVVTGISQPSGGGITNCYYCHFENQGTPSYTAWFNIASGQFTCISCIAQDDSASGSITQYGIASGSAQINWVLSKDFSAGETATELINFQGSSTGALFGNFNSSPALIPNLYNLGHGGVMDFAEGPTTPYTISAPDPLIFPTAPTINSGFGTSPSIATNNGPASFTVNVGTGGTASAGVIGLPAAIQGWSCTVFNQTAHAGNRADDTVQTASGLNNVSVQNQTKSTGAAVAWTASDILSLNCFAR